MMKRVCLFIFLRQTRELDRKVAVVHWSTRPRVGKHGRRDVQTVVEAVAGAGVVAVAAVRVSEIVHPSGD